MMSDKINDLEYAGLKYGRLSFVDEKPEKCVEIYNSYKKLPLRLCTGASLLVQQRMPEQ